MLKFEKECCLHKCIRSKKKNMKLSKYIAITLLSLSLAIAACGCDKDYTVGTPFENTDGSGSATATPGLDAPTGTDKQEGSGDKTTPAPTKTDNGTNPGNDPTASPTGTEPTGEAPTDTPTEAPTDEPAVVTSSPVSRDKFDRAEYRNMTFLIWLPAFEYGAFTGQESKGTFDYAVFSDVTKEEVLAYVSQLKNAGYTLKTSESSTSDTWTYSACNEKDWKAVLTYKNNTLTLGSGFEEVKEDDQNEEIRRLYSTTMLQYVPEFKGGTFTGSSGTGSSGSTGDYIMYGGVTKDSVLSYIEQVKSQGYIYAPEENYEGSSIWYIALNEESFECSVEFDGSSLKIGCTDCSED